MIIKVDTREHELFKQIKNLVLFIPAYKDLKLVSETLPIGDIIIADEKEEKLIIERKSIQDLLSSIKDGRYEEQSYRLNGLPHPNHNIYYLIEGDVNRMNRFKDNGMEKMMAYSAMFSLNYYKGFSVMRTFGMEETAVFICNTASKMKKSDRPAYYKREQRICETKPKTQENTNVTIDANEVSSKEEQEPKQEKEQPEEESVKSDDTLAEETKEMGSEKDYVSVVKKVKKENVTENNIGEIMLCQIPGVSSTTAIVIMEKFKTIHNLIKEMEINPECLQSVCYTTSAGQSRKITKTSIANIAKFLVRK
jgi:ERCC4-type nuclease